MVRAGGARRERLRHVVDRQVHMLTRRRLIDRFPGDCAHPRQKGPGFVPRMALQVHGQQPLLDDILHIHGSGRVQRGLTVRRSTGTSSSNGHAAQKERRVPKG